MSRRQFSKMLGSLVLAVGLLSAAPALADDFGPAEGAFSFLLVGMPILDGTIFIGGVTAAAGATAAINEGRPSAGWRKMSYAFGGLNAASTAAYVIAMGVTGLWPYLLWPCLAHAGLSISDFVLGWQNRIPDEHAARFSFVPTASLDVHGATFGGLALKGTF